MSSANRSTQTYLQKTTVVRRGFVLYTAKLYQRFIVQFIVISIFSLHNTRALDLYVLNTLCISLTDSLHARETREGWPLLSIEAEVNGDQRVQMKGVQGVLRQGWANLDQAHEDLDRNIFRDLSPTPKP